MVLDHSCAHLRQAWNAFPYTRTRYTCPLMEKFSLDIETIYANDAGTQVCAGLTGPWTAYLEAIRHTFTCT